jgi:hydroxymethylglutaryl-CoA synthase
LHFSLKLLGDFVFELKTSFFLNWFTKFWFKKGCPHLIDGIATKPLDLTNHYMASPQKQTGIEDIACYLPRLVYSITDLALLRGIEPDKLRKGLDLIEMRLPDTDEDVATMAAEAVWKLIKQNNLRPEEIGRIYVGTESGLDSSKPVASYVAHLIERLWSKEIDPRPLRHCDTVDLTFACIGAVDAMLTCTDWVRAGANRKAIVVATDIAKYDLLSTGEYTQGAGAVAVLITNQPTMMVLNPTVGVGMESEHDFFKPRQTYSKPVLVDTLEKWAGKTILAEFVKESLPLLSNDDDQIKIYRESPVFDGQFSNRCYTERAKEAMAHFRLLSKLKPIAGLLRKRWRRAIFHLPYAAHARRVGVELFYEELSTIEKKRLAQTIGFMPLRADFETTNAYEKAVIGFIKQVSNLPAYQELVQRLLTDAQQASMQVGNLYTGSIFLALASALWQELNHADDPTGQTYGFVAYGSGSKAKVFEGIIQPGWKTKALAIRLDRLLADRHPINTETYLLWHTNRLHIPIAPPSNRLFFLQSIDKSGVLPGMRHYMVVSS